MSILALIDVVQMSQVSGLSSIQLSPNRVCEHFSCVTVDVFPVYQVSPDITGYLPATSPVTPPVPESLPTSPVHLGSDSLSPGTTGSFDSLVGCRSLIEQEPDLSCLSPLLVPLPDSLILLPMPVPIPPQQLPVCQSPGESLALAVSSLLDLCREGPLMPTVGGPERMGPRPPPWVPLLKNPIVVAV